MSGSECLVNPPALVSGGESNNVLQIASLNSYVSGNADSKVALLFISNIHGTQLNSSCNFLSDQPSLLVGVSKIR